jgi:hypothetical protein
LCCLCLRHKGTKEKKGQKWREKSGEGGWKGKEVLYIQYSGRTDKKETEKWKGEKEERESTEPGFVNV